MAGLGPAIHVFLCSRITRRGWPACPGHDDDARPSFHSGRVGRRPVGTRNDSGVHPIGLGGAMTLLAGLVAQLLHIALMAAAAPTLIGLHRWMRARLAGRVGAVSVAAVAGPDPAAAQADRAGRERFQRDHRRTGGLRRGHRRRRVPGALLRARHDLRPVRRSAADLRVADGGARFAGAGGNGRRHGTGRDGGQPDDAARLPRGAGAAAGVVRARTAGGQPRSRRDRRDADRERRGLADRRRPRACRDATGGADRCDASRGAGAGSGRTRSCADRGYRRVAAAGLVQPDRRDVPAVRHGAGRRGADRLGGRDHRLAGQDAARRRRRWRCCMRGLAASDWCARRRSSVSRCCSACWPRCSCWPTWGPHDRRGGCGRAAAVDRIVVRPADRYRDAALRAAGAVRRRSTRRGRSRDRAPGRRAQRRRAAGGDRADEQRGAAGAARQRCRVLGRRRSRCWWRRSPAWRRSGRAKWWRSACR